jgi:hypothetical protein
MALPRLFLLYPPLPISRRWAQVAVVGLDSPSLAPTRSCWVLLGAIAFFDVVGIVLALHRWKESVGWNTIDRQTKKGHDFRCGPFFVTHHQDSQPTPTFAPS